MELHVEVEGSFWRGSGAVNMVIRAMGVVVDPDMAQLHDHRVLTQGADGGRALSRLNRSKFGNAV
jgi:hypothetical protein